MTGLKVQIWAPTMVARTAALGMVSCGFAWLTTRASPGVLPGAVRK
ncbi:hypothetical protein ACFWNG_05560 [Streptomyces sp. NPDC058391]